MLGVSDIPTYRTLDVRNPPKFLESAQKQCLVAGICADLGGIISRMTQWCRKSSALQQNECGTSEGFDGLHHIHEHSMPQPSQVGTSAIG